MFAAVSFSDRRFKCDFCPNTFHEEDDFNTHILGHFEKKNCLNCNKLLIRIGSKWYELHIDDMNLDESAEPKNDFLVEYMPEVKLEVCEDAIEFNDTKDSDSKSDDEDFDIDSSESDEYTPEIDHNVRRRRKSVKRKEPSKNGKTKVGVEKRDTEIANHQSVQPRRKERLPRVTCRICDRIILKYNFELHLQKMHVPRVIVTKEPIKCELCDKFFASAGTLKTHQAIHSGTKRFGIAIRTFKLFFFFCNELMRYSFLVCSYCGTSFRQLYHLTEHMNAHTGNKPYHCQVCDKRFGRLHILRAHQRVHTGEKPHRCTIDGCDRAYAYDIDLKR